MIPQVKQIEKLGRNVYPNNNNNSFFRMIGNVVDNARQLLTNFGLRPYRVFVLTVAWTGDQYGQGQVFIKRVREILPTPKVSDLSSIQRMSTTAGIHEEGRITVSEISINDWTEDELLGTNKQTGLSNPNERRVWLITEAAALESDDIASMMTDNLSLPISSIPFYIITESPTGNKYVIRIASDQSLNPDYLLGRSGVDQSPLYIQGDDSTYYQVYVADDLSVQFVPQTSTPTSGYIYTLTNPLAIMGANQTLYYIRVGKDGGYYIVDAGFQPVPVDISTALSATDMNVVDGGAYINRNFDTLPKNRAFVTYGDAFLDSDKFQWKVQLDKIEPDFMRSGLALGTT